MRDLGAVVGTHRGGSRCARDLVASRGVDRHDAVRAVVDEPMGGSHAAWIDDGRKGLAQPLSHGHGEAAGASARAGRLGCRAGLENVKPPVAPDEDVVVESITQADVARWNQRNYTQG